MINIIYININYNIKPLGSDETKQNSSKNISTAKLTYHSFVWKEYCSIGYVTGHGGTYL
jgi:hypothetical protein